MEEGGGRRKRTYFLSLVIKGGVKKMECVREGKQKKSRGEGKEGRGRSEGEGEGEKEGGRGGGGEEKLPSLGVGGASARTSNRSSSCFLLYSLLYLHKRRGKL